MQQELNVIIDGDASGFHAAAKSTQRGLSNVEAGAKSTARNVVRSDRAVRNLGGAMRMQAGGARMLSMQLSQVGQQAMATGNITQALAIQLPDIGLAFGAIGTAAGLVAGIALPAVISMFSDTSEESSELRDALDALTEQVDAFKKAVDDASMSGADLMESFGTASPVMQQVLTDLAAIEKIKAHEALHELNKEIAASATNAEYFTTQMGEIGNLFDIETTLRGNITVWKENREAVAELAKELDTLSAGGSINEMQGAALRLRDRLIETAGGIENMTAQQRQFLEGLNRSIMQMQILGATSREAERVIETGIIPAAYEAATAIGSALPSAESLRDRVAEIAAAAAEAARQALNMHAAIAQAEARGGGRGQDPRKFGFGDADLGVLEAFGGFTAAPYPTSGAGAGGGGGATNPIIAQLEAVREALATETETLKTAHEEQLEVLRAAFEQRLITQEEFQQLSLKSAEDYRQALSELDRGYHGDALSQAETFFGDMASALQNGNDKMQRAAEAFAAIETLINAWRAYNQVLADPSLPWFAKIPAAASVLAAGLNAVQAVSGGGSGGGGGSSAAAAAQASQQTQPRIVLNVQPNERGDVPMETFTSTIETINDELNLGGRIVA